MKKLLLVYILTCFSTTIIKPMSHFFISTPQNRYLEKSFVFLTKKSNLKSILLKTHRLHNPAIEALLIAAKEENHSRKISLLLTAYCYDAAIKRNLHNKGINLIEFLPLPYDCGTDALLNSKIIKSLYTLVLPHLQTS